MSCGKRGCKRKLRSVPCYCRCGLEFCSEACFVSEWHARHSNACPKAAEIKKAVADGKAKGNVPPTKLLVASAVSSKRIAGSTEATEATVVAPPPPTVPAVATQPKDVGTPAASMPLSTAPQSAFRPHESAAVNPVDGFLAPSTLATPRLSASVSISGAAIASSMAACSDFAMPSPRLRRQADETASSMPSTEQMTSLPELAPLSPRMPQKEVERSGGFGADLSVPSTTAMDSLCELAPPPRMPWEDVTGSEAPRDVRSQRSGDSQHKADDHPVANETLSDFDDNRSTIHARQRMPWEKDAEETCAIAFRIEPLPTRSERQDSLASQPGKSLWTPKMESSAPHGSNGFSVNERQSGCVSLQKGAGGSFWPDDESRCFPPLWRPLAQPDSPRRSPTRSMNATHDREEDQQQQQHTQPRSAVSSFVLGGSLQASGPTISSPKHTDGPETIQLARPPRPQASPSLSLATPSLPSPTGSLQGPSSLVGGPPAFSDTPCNSPGSDSTSETSVVSKCGRGTPTASTATSSPEQSPAVGAKIVLEKPFATFSASQVQHGEMSKQDMGSGMDVVPDTNLAVAYKGMTNSTGNFSSSAFGNPKVELGSFVGGNSGSNGTASTNGTITTSVCASSTTSTSLSTGDTSGKRRLRRFSYVDFDRVGSAIGTGSYGMVTKVVHRSSGDVYAMKSVPKQKVVENDMLPYLLREVRTQLLMHHPRILQLHYYFEDVDHVHLLLEYASGGSLFHQLRVRGALPERPAAKVFVDVAGALSYLHGCGIVHRDLKPENILMCSGNAAKLADFGWCAELHRGSARKTFCGTWDYLSPEMLEAKVHDATVDVWCVGVLLFEMLTNWPPFQAETDFKAAQRIKSVDLQIPDTVSSGAASIIKALLVKEPIGRMGLSEAMQQPWVATNVPEAEVREALAHARKGKPLVAKAKQAKPTEKDTLLAPSISEQTPKGEVVLNKDGTIAVSTHKGLLAALSVSSPCLDTKCAAAAALRPPVATTEAGLGTGDRLKAVDVSWPADAFAKACATAGRGRSPTPGEALAPSLRALGPQSDLSPCAASRMPPETPGCLDMSVRSVRRFSQEEEDPSKQQWQKTDTFAKLRTWVRANTPTGNSDLTDDLDRSLRTTTRLGLRDKSPMAAIQRPGPQEDGPIGRDRSVPKTSPSSLGTEALATVDRTVVVGHRSPQEGNFLMPETLGLAAGHHVEAEVAARRAAAAAAAAAMGGSKSHSRHGRELFDKDAALLGPSARGDATPPKRQNDGASPLRRDHEALRLTSLKMLSGQLSDVGSRIADDLDVMNRTLSSRLVEDSKPVAKSAMDAGKGLIPSLNLDDTAKCLGAIHGDLDCITQTFRGQLDKLMLSSADEPEDAQQATDASFGKVFGARLHAATEGLDRGRAAIRTKETRRDATPRRGEQFKL